MALTVESTSMADGKPIPETCATVLTFYGRRGHRFFSPDAAGKSCILVTAIGESPRLRRA